MRKLLIWTWWCFCLYWCWLCVCFHFVGRWVGGPAAWENCWSELDPLSNFSLCAYPLVYAGRGEGSTKSTKQHFITLSTWSFWANMQSSLFTTYLANWTSHAPIPRQYNFSTASPDWSKFGYKSGEHFFPWKLVAGFFCMEAPPREGELRGWQAVENCAKWG